jgi:hypothetical protein
VQQKHCKTDPADHLMAKLSLTRLTKRKALVTHIQIEQLEDVSLWFMTLLTSKIPSLPGLTSQCQGNDGRCAGDC